MSEKHHYCQNGHASATPCPFCEVDRLAAQNAALLAALENLVKTFEDGSHYQTQNPYTRPQVKAALAAIAAAKGKE